LAHRSRPTDHGDLFAYALARTSGEPLLFKGDDFAKTDVGRVR
jgi:ribonuclease VapC